MPQYLTAAQLEVGKYYKIERPFTWFDEDDEGNRVGAPHRGVHTYIGKLTRGAPNFLFTDIIPRGNASVALRAPLTTTPINMADPDDESTRVSLASKELVVSKALSGVPEDPSKKIRGFLGGKKRKTRRRGKKTLRKK
jgi:hypothetical protein